MTKKLLKTCVFACFPAGNQVHTEQDFKNIEEIQAGDKVWAYNEETGEIALQEVLYTIETTALHPFYVNRQWKEASELEKGDRIITQNKEEIEIKSVEFKYTSQKVYNFEVEESQCYFVGKEGFLVLNICEKLLKEILADIPNKLLKGDIVDISKFTKSVRDSSDKLVGNGWKIARDRAGANAHGGSFWKLVDKKGNRIATLDEFGNILRR